MTGRLTGLLRPGDTLARFAGDEFVILCEDLTGPDQATVIAERLHVALGQPFVLPGAAVDVTASVGIAYAGTVADSAEQLLRDADMAMYQAKRRGGGHHQILDLRAQNLADRQASPEVDLRTALSKSQLRLEYQAIVATVDGQITGVEAFLRWDHPERGSVAPSTLIPIAEQTGLISEIGHWVLDTAWADRPRWDAPQTGQNLTVAVNVSTHQLMAPGFAATVADILNGGSTDAQLLSLELTENVFIRDPARARVVLSDLKDLGVTIALDDFGTGHSSLNYLKQFPIDIVKIDPSFVAQLGRDPTSRLIVDAVVRLAHGLGMTVVAEGVETVEHCREVTDIGCDRSQGYYFARPMTPARLDSIIGRRVDGHNPRLPQPAQPVSGSDPV